jgi:ABC-type uncharacterized transport system YnjBCD ATPase subunit
MIARHRAVQALPLRVIAMISLNNATLMRGELVLLRDASLAIHNGQKIGVIGRNGSGKSSLFACLLGQLALDQGDLSMPEGLRCAHMRQETVASATSAVDFVIDGDARYREIERLLHAAEAKGDGSAIAHLHSDMDKIGGYDIRFRAMQLLSGLGLTVRQSRLELFRGLAHPPESRRRPDGTLRPAAAGRAHQPPRPGSHAMAGTMAQALSGHAADHFPRPQFSRRSHLVCGERRAAETHTLSRQLQQF